MPRKKTVLPDEQPMEDLTAAEIGEEESDGQFAEAETLPDTALAVEGDGNFGEAPFADAPSEGTLPDDTAFEDTPPGYDFPAGEENPFPETEDTAEPQQPSDDMGAESDDPEYGALLQELGEAERGEADTEAPLTLDAPSGEEPAGNDLPPALELENDAAGEEPAQPQRTRGRPRRRGTSNATPAADPRRERVLTIEARDEVQTEEEREAIIWHEIQNAHWTRRILTGTLDGVEQTESGLTVAVVNYKGFRVAIPVKEMMLLGGQLPSGAEYQELMARMRSILTARLGSEIDFVVKGHENKTRSIVASRKDAMLRKRQVFYLDTDELGQHKIREGRVVQARVVAVAEKIIRVEVFGVECAIVARDLAWSWVGNAEEHYHVGDRILVRVLKINGNTPENLIITADVRSVSAASSRDDLKKCVRQGRYVGRVTDVRGGVVYIRLNNGVNAIAHSCYDRRTPGKRDDVSFSVTRLDQEQGVAIGIITRIIKQNL